jgi:hypothetical protein
MGDVYTQLKYLSERHTEFRNLFHQFYLAGTPFLKACNIPGITLGKLGADQFEVSLAGTTARFLFTLSVPQDGRSRGRVTCYRLDPLKQPEALEHVGHFEFDGRGDTGKKMASGPTEGDPMLVGTDSHAGQLIADLLHQAIVAASTGTKGNN